MTDPEARLNEQGRVLLARLKQRCDNLGGCDLYGADHEDVERALPLIEREAWQAGYDAGRKDRAILNDEPSGHWFTVDSLAAAFMEHQVVKWVSTNPIVIDTDYDDLAAATIAALADDGYTIVSQMEWMDRADPTLAADLALAAAVRDIEAEFHPLRAIAATSGPDGWEMTVEGYDLAGTIVYRSGKGQTLGEAFTAIIQAAPEKENR